MVTKITKLRSRNLLGETPQQEKIRLNKVIVKEILKGKTPNQIFKLSSLKGANKTQLSNRKKILKKSGLSRQKAQTIGKKIGIK